MKSEFKIFRVIYEFRHSKMGFQNSVTVESLNEQQAIEQAKREVSQVYGSKMLPRFIFPSVILLKNC